MNKKLIAAAVSAVVVSPVAHGEASWYGRVNNAIDINDIAADGDSTTDITGVTSRLGVRYNNDIGNGMTAHGQFEFWAESDKEGPGIRDTRVATVGLSGAFGRVDVGNQWSSYFNTFGTLVSPTYSLGYYLYSSVGGAPYRASNTIKYSNSFGPVSAQLDLRFNDSDEDAAAAEKIRGNGIGLGLSFAVSDNITIAAAFDNEDGADDQSAVAGSNPVVTDNYNPGNEDRRGAVTVDFASGVEQRFVAVTEAGTGGGAITADGSAITAQAGEVEAAGQVIKPGVTGVAAGDNPDSDRVGIAIKGDFGGYWASIGWQNHQVDANERTGDGEVDVDTTFIYGGGSISDKTSWLIGYSKADDAADAVADTAPALATGAVDEVLGSLGSPETGDSTQLTWGVYHNMGGGMRLYYEATSLDSENNEWDGARHLLGMRVDF